MKRTSSFTFLFVVSFIGFLIFQTSCDNAKTPVVNCSTTPTYDTEIAPIIATNCAIGGCHVSGTGTPGIFPDYDGLLPYLNSDENGFKDWVINRKGMPLGFSLSDEDFELVRCWVEGGYLEN